MSLRRRLAFAIVVTALPLVLGLWLFHRELEQRSALQALREFAVAHMEAIGRERCETAPEAFYQKLPEELRRPPPPKRGPGGSGPGGPWPGGPGSGGPGPGGPGGPGPGGPGHDRRSPGHGPRPQDRDRSFAESRPGSRPDERRKPPGTPLPGSPPVVYTELWAYDAQLESANPRAPELSPDLADALRAGADAELERCQVDGVHGYQALVRMPWSASHCDFVLVRRQGPNFAEVERGILLAGAAVCVTVLVAVLLAAGPLVRRIRRLTGEVRRTAAGRYASPVEMGGRDEIAVLGRAFNEAGLEVRQHLESLEQREQTLRDFVANTTHDVMLPLTVLQGHLADLHEVPGPHQETVLGAMEEAHYMASLVHNLSAAARLETGTKEPERYPIALGELIERVVARHRPVARPRGVALDFSVPEMQVGVLGDVTLLEQAVSNVVHNAVRYNRPGGHVAVVLTECLGSPPEFSLRVIDDGPGVPEDQLARLTERRFRGGEARSRAPEGLGLGLSIAHLVAQRHGLSLELRRSEAGGLEVELRGAIADGAALAG